MYDFLFREGCVAMPRYEYSWMIYTYTDTANKYRPILEKLLIFKLIKTFQTLEPYMKAPFKIDVLSHAGISYNK